MSLGEGGSFDDLGAGAGLGPGREFDLIRRILGPRAPQDERVLLGPGDDAAVVAGGLVLSTDLTVEGVHFRREWLSPREVGFRAAAAAVSDLAAMAAEPIGVLVSLALPAEDAEVWAPEIGVGVRSLLERIGGALLGGDLSSSPGPVMIDVVAVGTAASPVTRGGAMPGDEVWVTGSLGGSRAAVTCMEGGETPTTGMLDAFKRPIPRVAEALWLRDRTAMHAMVDLSDGLAADSRHIATASRVAVVLEADRIPVHPDLPSGKNGASEALQGGEDYELLFAVPRGGVEPLVAKFAERFGVGLTRVGQVESGTGVSVVAPPEWGEMEVGVGFDHFHVEG